MDFSFTDNDKEVIKKTNFVFNFSITKTFLGTFVGPTRRVPGSFWVHLVVVCMNIFHSDNRNEVIKKTKLF